jgi:uncharacterized protein YerC
MTRISRRPLKKELEERMFEVFWQCFVDLKTPKEVFEFFESFLSPAEKVMLAKRLAIAVLLEKGFNTREISLAVKVSTGTVNAIRSQIRYFGAGYKRAVDKIIAGEKTTDFLEDLTTTLASIVSPVGKLTLTARMKDTTKKQKEFL